MTNYELMTKALRDLYSAIDHLDKLRPSNGNESKLRSIVNIKLINPMRELAIDIEYIAEKHLSISEGRHIPEKIEDNPKMIDLLPGCFKNH